MKKDSMYLSAEELKIERELSYSGHIKYLYWVIRYVYNKHNQKMLSKTYATEFYKRLYAISFGILWLIGLLLILEVF